MKLKIAALLIASVTMTANTSYGFELLDRMLGRAGCSSCEAPITPSCGCGGTGLMDKVLNRSLCEAQSCGCEAVAPAIGYEPVQADCGCQAAAPSCGCEAPAPSCGCSKRGGLLQRMADGVGGIDCGCETAAPSCGCEAAPVVETSCGCDAAPVVEASSCGCDAAPAFEPHTTRRGGLLARLGMSCGASPDSPCGFDAAPVMAASPCGCDATPVVEASSCGCEAAPVVEASSCGCNKPSGLFSRLGMSCGCDAAPAVAASPCGCDAAPVVETSCGCDAAPAVQPRGLLCKRSSGMFAGMGIDCGCETSTAPTVATSACGCDAAPAVAASPCGCDAAPVVAASPCGYDAAPVVGTTSCGCDAAPAVGSSCGGALGSPCRLASRHSSTRGKLSLMDRLRGNRIPRDRDGKVIGVYNDGCNPPCPNTPASDCGCGGVVAPAPCTSCGGGEVIYSGDVPMVPMGGCANGMCGSTPAYDGSVALPAAAATTAIATGDEAVPFEPSSDETEGVIVDDNGDVEPVERRDITQPSISDEEDNPLVDPGAFIQRGSNAFGS